MDIHAYTRICTRKPIEAQGGGSKLSPLALQLNLCRHLHIYTHMAPPWGLSTPRAPKELFQKFRKSNMVTKQVFFLRISATFCMREAVTISNGSRILPCPLRPLKRPKNNDLLLEFLYILYILYILNLIDHRSYIYVYIYIYIYIDNIHYHIWVPKKLGAHLQRAPFSITRNLGTVGALIAWECNLPIRDAPETGTVGNCSSRISWRWSKSLSSNRS